MPDASGYAKTETPTGWRAVLERAADYIEVHGWCQGMLSDDSGGRCALGAIYESRPGYIGDATPERLEAHRYLEDRVGGVSLWNNKRGRTASEVIATLRECAMA